MELLWILFEWLQIRIKSNLSDIKNILKNTYYHNIFYNTSKVM